MASPEPKQCVLKRTRGAQLVHFTFEVLGSGSLSQGQFHTYSNFVVSQYDSLSTHPL